jgi:hypothetical protein
MANTTETKNQPPKSDASSAAPQYPFGTFDPMAAWAASQQSFHQMMTESYARAQAWAEEYAALEAQMLARATGAIDTWARLAHDSINYAAQLSAQARKLGFEAVRKAGVGAA